MNLQAVTPYSANIHSVKPASQLATPKFARLAALEIPYPDHLEVTDQDFDAPYAVAEKNRIRAEMKAHYLQTVLTVLLYLLSVSGLAQGSSGLQPELLDKAIQLFRDAQDGGTPYDRHFDSLLQQLQPVAEDLADFENAL